MKRRYKIRVHESGNKDGATAAGTLVLHRGGGISIEAVSVEEADTAVRKSIREGKMERGCVYQICPPADSAESLRMFAAALEGEPQACFLETAGGLYGGVPTDSLLSNQYARCTLEIVPAREPAIGRAGLEKTVVAITGASSGIGEAFARKLAPGHDLLLVARRRERLQALADEFANKFGTATEIVQADLTKEAEINDVAARLSGETRLALLVNNAGFGTKGRFWETSIESQEQMHRLHVLATLRLTYAALQNMVRSDFGGIVNVASVSSFVRSPGTTSYSATKAWMTAFTEGLYIELRGVRSNVTVQALCPGFTYSEFQSAMGTERYRLAGPSWWLTAEEVVDASIEGLRRRKLFVVPGWRYKLALAMLTKLPTPLRLGVEAATGRARLREIPVNVAPQKDLPDGD